MCCAPKDNEGMIATGVCDHCGEPTIDMEAVEACSWSAVECEECGFAPCDGSC